MLRSADRKLLIAIYAFMAWKFLTFSSIAAAGAVVLAVQSQIGSVALVPIAALLATFGVITLRGLRDAIHAPYF